jgi:hypothetical protein
VPDPSLGMLLTGLVPGLVLVVAGASHLAALPALRSDLGRQGLLPAATVTPIVAVLPVAELAVGATGVATVAGGAPAAWAVASHAAIAMLYLSFTVYAAALLQRSRGAPVPCGCSPTGAAVTALVPLRAAVFALLAGTAVVATPTLVGVGGAEVIVAWLAAATFVVLLWSAPSALDTPATTRATAHGATQQTSSRRSIDGGADVVHS